MTQLPVSDRDQRHRARYGFGFRLPQAKHGRPRPGSRVAVAGDVAPATMNGEAGHVVNGVSEGRASTATHGPATTAGKDQRKEAPNVHRQTANKTKQSLRRPAQKGGASSSYQQQQRGGKMTLSSDIALNGGGDGGVGPGKVSVPPSARCRPSSDKSVKLLVNYRSTNNPHAPLQSAYGNRDFFGPSTSSSATASARGRKAADVAAGCQLATHQNGKDDDVIQSVQSTQSRLEIVVFITFTVQRTLLL